MTRSLYLTLFTATMASLGAACGDDTTTPDAGGDTIVDSADGVDATANDSTTATDATTATDSTTATDATTATDSATGDDGTATDTTADDTATDTGTPPEDVVEPILAIVLNEVSAAGVDPDWVEIYNAGTVTVDLAGYKLRDNDELHAYIFPADSILPPDTYYVVSEDPAGVAGFDFGFGDADEAILIDPSGNVVDESGAWILGQAPAGASWGRFPNGSGSFKTLWVPTQGKVNGDNPATFCGNNLIEPSELCDGTALPDGVACSDRGYGGGTLGCAACNTLTYDACTPHPAGLVINEVTSDGVDKIELYNGSPTLISLNGYQIEDGNLNTFTIGNKSIAAGAYVVFTKDVDPGFIFGLGTNDAVTLRDKTGAEVDFANYPENGAIPSWCRTPNGTGGFKTCATQTFGAAN